MTQKEKINIAELLKDCPKGMELDCTICNNVVTLEGVDTVGYYPIRVMSKDGFHHILTHEGCVYKREDAKCVIFPKGKTTWEGFVPPCKFKDGDVLVHTQNGRFIMSIYKSNENEKLINTHVIFWDREEGLSVGMQICCYTDNVRFATKEEKAKLFQAIKDNGYKWNPDTKTLERLVEPSEGTLVQIDLTRELRIADEVEVILGDYEFVLKDGKTYFVKKKPQYPKTYEECCRIVNANPCVRLIYDLSNGQKYSYDVDNLQQYENIRKLLICRDAYWKIAGEEMGLDEPWKPTNETVYCISRSNNVIKSSYRGGKSNVLEFPTTEMRDAFYDNFKELINEVKELL